MTNWAGRRFAQGLARRIAAWDGSDSLVIALCGEWGCGKTSLKNLILEDLSRGKTPAVDLLEFNPWEISGHDSVAAAFFRELSVVLDRNTDDATDDAARASKLRAYAKLATLGGSAVKWLGNAFKASGHEYGAAVEIAGQAAELAGGAIAGAGEAVGQSADAYEARGKAKEQSLADLKRSLSGDMAKLKRPVLIVIDDLDRLTHDEIREVFQLVKANADFPNLIYLLMFDREIVSNALDTISGGRGQEFLDKIVQVLFHVPQPLMSNVHKLLFDGLDTLLAAPGVLKRWDSERWSTVWADGLSAYFTNLRSVYRFLGSLGFNIAQMQNGETFELNPLDLIVLETLRLYESKLYDNIPVNRSLFVSERVRRFLSKDENRKERAEEFERLLTNSVSEARRTRVRSILTHLFPVVAGHSHSDDNALLRDLRVGHEKIFPRYFTLSLAEDDISQADLDAVLNNLSDPKELVQVCAALQRRNLLEPVFERLDAYNGTFPKGMFPRMITALCDVGDTLPGRDWAEGGVFSFDPLTHAWRAIFFSLQNVPEQEQIFHYLESGMLASQGVRLSVQLAGHEERGKNRDQVIFLVSEEQSVKLKAIALERIRNAAADGRLREMPGIRSVLYRWFNWTERNEPKGWLVEQVQNPADALWVLRTCLNVMRSESGRRIRYTRFILLNELEDFADTTLLVAKTAGLEIAKLQQTDQRALRAFRQALAWRAEGKPDDYGRNSLHGDHPLTEDS